MKLGFKVTSKDMGIFIGFSIVLLLFVAIAVLNCFSLLNDGVFYGLNPIEAFSGKYIGITLFVFIGVEIAIFFSVSSSIFESDKGFGLHFGEKEEKGYSRWLKEKEMKKAFNIYKVGVQDETASAGGVVFINDGKNMWVDNGENHTLVIGVTGAGKTTAVVDPLIYSLCKHGESMVITDPKGEIYRNHAELLKARGYQIVVLNFRNPNMGNSWNPLSIPYQMYQAGNVDKATELVDDVALNILQDKKAQDPFWEKSASDYFSGCALGLLEDASEEQVNLNSISLMTTVGEDKFGAGSTYIKEYFTLKGEQSAPYTFASNTINSPTETKGGILSVFRQKIRLFASREQLSEMLSYSDFNMRDIGKVKTAVFMIIHDEKTTYHALATIFIKQCYETLIDVAQENGGPLPVRTNFILDEFANMPPLKDVTTMVTAARSRKIRFTFIIQNFAQLNDVYGKEDAETIRSNCGNLMYLLTTELSALEEISKLCGEVKSKKDEKTATQPLVTVSDLQKLKLNEVIILRNRYHPFRTKLKQGFDTDWGDKEFGKADFFEREKKEIQYFDVKEFVKLRKKSKMMDGLEPKGGADNLGFGGMGASSTRPDGMPRIPTFEEFMAARNGNKKPTEEAPKRPTLPQFNVDDLVKRIDAKIAELEAQEKAEADANGGGQKPTPVTAEPVPNPVVVPRVEEENIISTVASDLGANNNRPVQETKFFDKNVIEDDDSIAILDIDEEQPKDLSNMVNGGIKTFSDIIGGDKSPMISNPIDTETKVPTMPAEPIINKPIIGPSVNPDEEKTELFDDETINQIKKAADNYKPQVPATNNVQVDNSSKVINDDEFFDDFFE